MSAADPKPARRVDCEFTARQFAEFGSRLELTAGSCALVFGALGAEPVSGILGAAVAVGDGIKFAAGGYIDLTYAECPHVGV